LLGVEGEVVELVLETLLKLLKVPLLLPSSYYACRSKGEAPSAGDGGETGRLPAWRRAGWRPRLLRLRLLPELLLLLLLCDLLHWTRGHVLVWRAAAREACYRGRRSKGWRTRWRLGLTWRESKRMECE
jgi:hypothetical protein